MKPIMTPAMLLACISWASVFVLAWCMIAKVLSPSTVNWFFWTFFLLLALCASAMSMQKPRGGGHNP